MKFRQQYALPLLTVLTIALSPQPLFATAYVYKHSDGTVWHTNIKPGQVDKSEYQLIGVINTPAPRKKKKANKKTLTSVMCGGLKRGSLAKLEAQYKPIINRLAERYSISSYLVMAVVATESCFDSRAESVKGARGLMQLMPITARELGVENPFDHEENLRGGIEYLGKLSKRFNYNPKLTLAAYNAGPGNVEKYKGIPPFPETQAYVEKVMQKFQIYLQKGAG